MRITWQAAATICPESRRRGRRCRVRRVFCRSKVLYAQNCAGCHGADGLHGPATPLASPVYQALVDDATLRRVIAQGRPNSMMPAFAKSGGGELTDAQVDCDRARNTRGLEQEQCDRGRTLPPYADDGKGNAKRVSRCMRVTAPSCHGPAGGKIGRGRARYSIQTFCL